MKCVIPGSHVKVFGRAVHSLSKVGDELYFEWLESGLALRTVNSSRSAYCCFLFNPMFFQSYEDGKQVNDTGSEHETSKCKIAIKSCLSVFRSLSSIEKTVECCKIIFHLDEARLIFQLICKHGILKTHNLSFIECETLQAVFNPDDNPNYLTAQAKLLSDIVASFQNNQDEITLHADQNRVSFKNYIDEFSPDSCKTMRTELNLSPNEFDLFQLKTDVDITFCLKELRAVLSFCEATNLPLSFHFDSAGKPIIFSIDGDKLFTADIVLATLADVISNKSTQEPTLQQNKTVTAVNDRLTTSESQDLRNDYDNTPRAIVTSIRPNISDEEPILNSVPTLGKTKTHTEHHPVNSSQFNSPLISEHIVDLEEAAKSCYGDAWNVNSDGEDTQPPSPVIPKQVIAEGSVTEQMELCDSDVLNDSIPGTPPRKKFKALFFGTSQISSQLTQRNQSQVLAADSDDD